MGRVQILQRRRIRIEANRVELARLTLRAATNSVNLESRRRAARSPSTHASVVAERGSGDSVNLIGRGATAAAAAIASIELCQFTARRGQREAPKIKSRLLAAGCERIRSRRCSRSVKEKERDLRSYLSRWAARNLARPTIRFVCQPILEISALELENFGASSACRANQSANVSRLLLPSATRAHAGGLKWRLNLNY